MCFYLFTAADKDEASIASIVGVSCQIDNTYPGYITIWLNYLITIVTLPHYHGYITSFPWLHYLITMVTLPWLHWLHYLITMVTLHHYHGYINS